MMKSLCAASLTQVNSTGISRQLKSNEERSPDTGRHSPRKVAS